MHENIAVPSPVDLSGTGPASAPHSEAMHSNRSEVYRVLPRRAGALLLDSLIWVIPIIGLAISVGRTIEPVLVETADGWELSEQVTFYLSFFQIWSVTCLWFTYLIVSELFFGATLGKKAFGVTVVQSDGTIAGAKTVVLRQMPRFMAISLLSLFSLYALVPFVFMIEGVVARYDGRRQRIGDRLGDTVVVRADRVRIPSRTPSASSAWIPSEAGGLPVPARETAVAGSEYAGFWPRLGAVVVDAIVIMVLNELLAIPALTTSIIAPPTGSTSESFGTMFTASDWFGSTLLTLLGFGYFIYFNGRGATLGKRLFGIQVVGTTGRAPGMRKAAIRHIIPAGSALVSLGFQLLLVASYNTGGLDGVLVAGAIALVVGFAYLLFSIYDGLSMLWNNNQQTIHDRMAGTFVVRGNRISTVPLGASGGS